MIYDSSLYIFKLPFVSLLQLHLNGNDGGGMRRDWDKNHDTDLHLYNGRSSSSSDNFERYVSGKLSTSANVIQGNKKIVSLVILITVIMTRGVHVVQQLKWRNFSSEKARQWLHCKKKKKKNQFQPSCLVILFLYVTTCGFCLPSVITAHFSTMI